ncbi:MAG: class I SAM-dependent methyltransferase [Candidatus Dormibacteraceae bacterium]
MPELLVRNISDTALGIAVHRARESERAGALFRDPLAARLAGKCGLEIAKSNSFWRQDGMGVGDANVLVRPIHHRQVRQGADLVVNPAAGLDTRPYRMALPATLEWVEVDVPGLIGYKEEILRGEKPTCELERIRLDLSHVSARRTQACNGVESLVALLANRCTGGSIPPGRPASGRNGI